MIAPTLEHVEIEAVLAIVSDPDGFSRRIAEMSTGGHGCPTAFRMEPRPTRVFHNTYLDTPGHALGAGLFTLRVRRRSNGKQRITVKGPPDVGSVGLAGNGIVSRLEIQADVRYDGLLELLSRMGLQIVQEQTVSRQAYDILDPIDLSVPPLAELAIDAVEYVVHGRTVRFHEVEIESKGDDPDCIGNVTDWLLEVFGDQLRTWTHNKLSTGRAIEVDNLQFEESGDLTIAAYSRIEQHLTQGGKDGGDHQDHRQ